MFSKNLSVSVLSYCDCQKLTYEAASDLCKISTRHFASIARGQTAASVNMLEKICDGFQRMPNELLGFTSANDELNYRLGWKVDHFRRVSLPDGACATRAVCPRCLECIDHEYYPFCPRCGQKLIWDSYQHATLLLPH